MTYFCAMFQTGIILQEALPFDTPLKVTKADWFGLTLFFVGLFFFMILLYRNPVILRSLVARTIKSNSDKLYFSAPAIDTIDKILLFLIYWIGAILVVHFFIEAQFLPQIRWMLYLVPVGILLYWFIPFFLISQLLGFTKISLAIWKKQVPIIFLAGLVLLSAGLLLFVDLAYEEYFKLLIFSILIVFYFWIHLRVWREFILSGFKFYYIFMYFCTLEILPFAFLWVWFSRI